MHPTPAHSEDEYKTCKLCIKFPFSVGDTRGQQHATASQLTDLLQPRRLLCAGQVSVTSLTNLSIASCTTKLHYFMRSKAQKVIHASRKTGVRGTVVCISVVPENVVISQNCIC